MHSSYMVRSMLTDLAGKRINRMKNHERAMPRQIADSKPFLEESNSCLTMSILGEMGIGVTFY